MAPACDNIVPTGDCDGHATFRLAPSFHSGQALSAENGSACDLREPLAGAGRLSRAATDHHRRADALFDRIAVAAAGEGFIAACPVSPLVFTGKA